MIETINRIKDHFKVKPTLVREHRRKKRKAGHVKIYIVRCKKRLYLVKGRYMEAARRNFYDKYGRQKIRIKQFKLERLMPLLIFNRKVAQLREV